VSTYLLDHGWSGERERLDGLGSVFDSGTVREFEAVGVGPGWRCLEIGGGSGTVARWLCERVGPGGRVVATDLDTGFLEGLRLPGLEVRHHDIVVDELEEGAFDLVHTRLVLEHLRDRDRDLALARMARALAPGGWLVVEAFEFSRVAVTSSNPSPAVRRAAVVLPALFRAVLTAVRPAGLDARVGHRLPAELCRLGLADVTAEGRSVFIQGGSATAGVARLSLARFAEIIADPPDTLHSAALWTAPGVLQRLAPLRRQIARQLRAIEPLFDDAAVWTMAPAMVAARGRRPPGSP
jgi:SAM-dependent methyltransferase